MTLREGRIFNLQLTPGKARFLLESEQSYFLEQPEPQSVCSVLCCHVQEREDAGYGKGPAEKQAEAARLRAPPCSVISGRVSDWRLQGWLCR